VRAKATDDDIGGVSAAFVVVSVLSTVLPRNIIRSIFTTRRSFDNRIVYCVFAVYVMVQLVPFIYAASHSTFYDSQAEPGAALLCIALALLVCAPMRRYVWRVIPKTARDYRADAEMRGL
jgi:glucan phosphoethanolaminetransferase (alkaline phosphatase superfamily)